MGVITSKVFSLKITKTIHMYSAEHLKWHSNTVYSNEIILEVKKINANWLIFTKRSIYFFKNLMCDVLKK